MYKITRVVRTIWQIRFKAMEHTYSIKYFSIGTILLASIFIILQKRKRRNTYSRVTPLWKIAQARPESIGRYVSYKKPMHHFDLSGCYDFSMRFRREAVACGSCLFFGSNFLFFTPHPHPQTHKHTSTYTPTL